MSIKIYSCNDSRGLRPMWTAEEMGVGYESEMMPFPPRFLHKEYMDVNILGTIPYLIDVPPISKQHIFIYYTKFSYFYCYILTSLVL